jgi:uncharacterized membrane protein YphA (DoxX/SURF4 family)
MEYKYYAMEFLVRAFTGIIFLFQGYDKLFKVKISGVVQTFKYQAQKEHIPNFFLQLMATYSSVVEFLGGLLLIFGFFKNIALSLLGIDLLLVAAAFSMLEPIWDMKHVYPRLVLVSALLMFPNTWERYSLDYFINELMAK